MGRLLVILAVSMLISTACTYGSDRSKESTLKKYERCTMFGEDLGEGPLCVADSFSLISNVDMFCGLRVATFGYAMRHEWVGMSIYPDKERARRQVVTSGILISDEVAEASILEEMRRMGESGIHVEMTAVFKCKKNDFTEGVVSGELVDVVRVSVADLALDGEFIRNRNILGDKIEGELVFPPEVKEP